MDILKREAKRLQDLWGVGKISLASVLHRIIEDFSKENGYYDDNNSKIPIYYDVNYLNEWKESLDLINVKEIRLDWAEKTMREVLKAKKDDESMKLYKTYTRDEKVEFIRDVYNKVVNEFNEWKENNGSS